MDKLREIKHLCGEFFNFLRSFTNCGRRQQEHVGNYVRGKLIGRGGCGSVYAGIRICDGLPVALKYVSKSAGNELLLPGHYWPTHREVGLMGLVNQHMGHPNILRLYEWFDKPDHIVMVLERPAPCMDLVDFCAAQNNNVMDEQLAQAVIEQLLHALLHCQYSGVFHQDVKPANILINTETLRVILIDFGCGDLWQDTPYHTFAGTWEFTAPEWFAKNEQHAGPATVWSVGVTLYYLVCGFFPFNKFDEWSMSTVDFPEGLSSEIEDFISWCLAPKMEDRATLEQLQLHPWLLTICSVEATEIIGVKRKMGCEGNLGPYSSSRPGKCPWKVGFTMEKKGNEEHGEQNGVHEEKLDLSSSLTTAKCPQKERSGNDRERQVRRKRCLANLKTPATCLRKDPEMIGVKRKMGCEGNLGPYSSSRPAKCPRKDEDGGSLQEALQLHILHCPGGEQGCEGEGLQEHGRQASVLSPGNSVQRGAQHPPPQPEQAEEEQPLGRAEELSSARSCLCTCYSCCSTVGFTMEKGNEEHGEQNGVHEEKLDLSSSLTTAKCPQKERSGNDRERQVRRKRCLANLKTPATCLRKDPEMIGVKRKMGCEGNLGPYSSSRPAKCPRKDEDGGSLQEALQLLILHCPGGEQGCEGEGLQEHGRQASVLSPGNSVQRGAQHPPPQPEQAEEEQPLGRAEELSSARSCLCTCYSCCSTVGFTMEKGNEEHGEQNGVHEEKLDLSSSLTTAKCPQKDPEMIGVKRKMGCEGNLGPYSSSRPAKCPRKDEDGGSLQEALQLHILHCPGGEQGCEGEGLQEHGRQASVLSPGNSVQRGAQHPPPQPEQAEEEQPLGRAEELSSARSCLCTCYSCCSTVGFTMEKKGNEEDGEQNGVHEEKLDLSSSLTTAKCHQKERSGNDRERQVRRKRCLANLKTPATCLRKDPEMIGVKRKMGCEGNLGPYSSSRPAKCPRKERSGNDRERQVRRKRCLANLKTPATCLRKDEDGGSLQEALQLHILHCPGGEQGCEGEGLQEHGRQASVLSPGNSVQRGAQHPPPQPEQAEEEQPLGRAEELSSARSCLCTCYSCCSTGPEPSYLPFDPSAGRAVTHPTLGYSRHWSLAFPEYDQWDALLGLTADPQGHETDGQPGTTVTRSNCYYTPETGVVLTSVKKEHFSAPLHFTEEDKLLQLLQPCPSP
ncbi:hypothetical protein SKAU_G00002880 [Synaphobranchus kaupii]|uniref:non-specific serine/threonine protein kinase n=1 Tax=Synaphobranchus kaupii TaxID=118154 RepID=A0A9Q1G9I2_SYNKA|nr:hypothetical protein SKAU_G00002880 [Synaphobranchus kaupii]